jgi:hypothetical protein
MSYWSENPEIYTYIIVKELIKRGLVKQDAIEDYKDAYKTIVTFYTHPDFPDICTKAAQAYWGDRVDEGMMGSEHDQ